MSQAGSLSGSGGGGGNITITGDTGVPIVGNNFVFSGGTTGLTFDGFGIDQTLYVENFNLPDTTSSTQGALTIGGTPFIHAYGGVLDENTFIGIASGNFTLTPGAGNAQFNNGIGARTLLSLTTGFGNNCMGQGAGQAITSGSLNCLVGSGAGGSIQNGIANVFIGNGSGQTLTTGCNNNIGIGQQALVFLATGSRNIGIGYVNAGLAYTGAESDNILISNNGVVGESNKMRLGTSGAGAGQVNATYIAGINGVDVGSVSSVVSISGDQLGTTTITAGTNISVIPGANTITIASTGAASFIWSKITVDQIFTANNGFICDKVGLLTLTLPATAVVGDIFEVTGINTAVGWRIAQNAGQTIYFGINNTTTGVTGYLESTQIRDSIRLVCVTTDTQFNVVSSLGNVTIA